MRNVMINSTIGFLFIASTSLFAQVPGLVAESCKTEIEKFCADKQHGYGEIRACLEAKKSESSEVCKKALDTTGPGKGKSRGQRR